MEIFIFIVYPPLSSYLSSPSICRLSFEIEIIREFGFSFLLLLPIVCAYNGPLGITVQ